MTDLFHEPADATPLDPGHRDDLLQTWITNRDDLNEAEQENIVKGLAWARRRRGVTPVDLLNDDYVKTLHKQMFGEVWKWAGAYRQNELNLGIEAYRIPSDMPAALNDVRHWVENSVYLRDEIAVRLHHRLTQIHAFPNGNGRHARMMADLLIETLGGEPFGWGRGNLADVGGYATNTSGPSRRQMATTLGRCWPLRDRDNDCGSRKFTVCGRFTQKYTWEELHRLYRLTQPARNLQPRYNICPTDPIDVIMPSDAGLVVVPMRWQLVPPWWKKPLKDLPATFNARAETVAEKPMFRDAFRRTRCLIPASGYYEWQTTSDGKQPYYITPADGSVLTIAGLWSDWRDRVNDETLTTCTMIITEANSFISAVHDRMPVLLDGNGTKAWLSGDAGLDLLKPASDDALRMWPVSRRVSKPGNGDDPSLIEPVAVHATTEPATLFRLN